MAQILADKTVKRLIGVCLIGASEACLNPNGIELRLGKHIRFLSTNEERDIPDGHFIKILPGENVIISSSEKLDLSKEAVGKLFPGKMLMAFITPTTTMMREGITQCSTKVDAGFVGQLNWGLRNSSIRELTLQQGEPIFKLTFWLLEDDEIPETAYGQKSQHQYQNTDGIMLSSRKIPADIPSSKCISSSLDRIDAKKQLKEAGYPFNYIGSELVNLHGQFEIVSKDVLYLKDDFEKRTTDLTEKIERETKEVVSKIDETRKNVMTETSNLLTQKFAWVVGVFISVVTLAVGGINLLQTQQFSASGIMVICVSVSVTSLAVIWGITRR